MSKCRNHPENEAAAYCIGCGTFVCEECRVTLDGKNYCRSCAAERLSVVSSANPAKDKAQEGHQEDPPRMKEVSKDANEQLIGTGTIFGIVSALVLGTDAFSGLVKSLVGTGAGILAVGCLKAGYDGLLRRHSQIEDGVVNSQCTHSSKEKDLHRRLKGLTAYSMVLSLFAFPAYIVAFAVGSSIGTSIGAALVSLCIGLFVFGKGAMPVPKASVCGLCIASFILLAFVVPSAMHIFLQPQAEAQKVTAEEKEKARILEGRKVAEEQKRMKRATSPVEEANKPREYVELDSWALYKTFDGSIPWKTAVQEEQIRKEEEKKIFGKYVRGPFAVYDCYDTYFVLITSPDSSRADKKSCYLETYYSGDFAGKVRGLGKGQRVNGIAKIREVRPKAFWTRISRETSQVIGMKLECDLEEVE